MRNKIRYVYIVYDMMRDSNIGVVTSEAAVMDKMHMGGRYKVETWEQNKRLISINEYRDKFVFVRGVA
jgi:hypothetical protein